MVQISSCGFLPLSIWTSYFRLGHRDTAGYRHREEFINAARFLDHGAKTHIRESPRKVILGYDGWSSI
jgi:hypothetical protein